VIGYLFQGKRYLWYKAMAPSQEKKPRAKQGKKEKGLRHESSWKEDYRAKPFEMT